MCIYAIGQIPLYSNRSPANYADLHPSPTHSTVATPRRLYTIVSYQDRVLSGSEFISLIACVHESNEMQPAFSLVCCHPSWALTFKHPPRGTDFQLCCRLQSMPFLPTEGCSFLRRSRGLHGEWPHTGLTTPWYAPVRLRMKVGGPKCAFFSSPSSRGQLAAWRHTGQLALPQR